jgi:hypothetical protein
MPTTPQGSGGAAGGNVGSTVQSVSCSISVHAIVSGQCGACTNSTGFQHLELQAAFTGMTFLRPMGKGIPGPFDGMYNQGSTLLAYP